MTAFIFSGGKILQDSHRFISQHGKYRKTTYFYHPLLKRFSTRFTHVFRCTLKNKYQTSTESESLKKSHSDVISQ